VRQYEIETDTETMTCENTIERPWMAFHDAALMGRPGEILAALQRLVAEVPEIADWFAKEARVPRSTVLLALASGAVGESEEFDERSPDAWAVSGWSCGQDEEMEELLDQAAMFGTLDEVLDELHDEDPMAAATIGSYYGLNCEPKTFRQVGEELERSGQMCRRYEARGRAKLRERMDARK
jgi:hypothetical protein